ncbi:replication initiation protein [Massilia sp. H6]|uniref:replication initiation protein n=1 Tax=Massilia sp. H6 TaxID=2970464 RepID=UPI00216A0D4A|nr:replication initiation protein [Massilia sp. H6]UVW30676.1 replication initiation protein [Massilia sp. H6]
MAEKAKGTTANAAEIVDTSAKSVAPRTELEIRKSNEAIGLRVVSGRLTLLNRKVFNVLMYHAQRIRKLGQDAPIDTPAAQKYFWVPLSVLARNASYDSRDMQFLREQISEMQDIKLLLETDRQWTSERLIASVTFVNPKGLHSRTGQVWVGFAFPPEVHESVMQPETYTRLSIHYQGLLKSGTALALYELCRRYATNPSKLTSTYSVEHWYGLLTGNPVPEKAEDLPEYKYFKRDVLKNAIAEVNRVTDIDVELIEHKLGRRVQQLQFRVEFKPDTQQESRAPFTIDLTLLEKLMGLGMSQHEASNVIGEYPDEKIGQALAVVDARVNSANGGPIHSKVAYLRWALKSEAKLPDKKTGPRLKTGSAAEGPTLLERFLTARAKLALDVFTEMDAEQRSATFEQFKAQASGKVPALEKALDKGVTRTALSLWYADALWGEPTVESLSHFADKNQMLM